MCFDLDSRPPIEPIAGGAIDSEEVILRAGDGGRFAGLLARAEKPPRGRRSSSCRTSAACTRTTRSWRCASPRRASTHSRSTTSGGPQGSGSASGRPTSTSWRTWARRATRTCRGTSRRRPTCSASSAPAGDAGGRTTDGAGGALHRGRAIFTIGFCFGGRLAFLANTLGLDLAGSIGFYGWPVGARGDIPAPADSTGLMTGPVLGIFGGADRGIPPEAVEAFRDALAATGLPHDVVTYPAAPHSFFDRKAEDFADASADAWERVLAFIRTNTPA